MIPTNLDECIQELEKSENIEGFKNLAENDAIWIYHFNIGMYIRNEWGLWKGSELAKWFNNKDIYHADDMSSIIFASFHRHLNGKPIDLDEQVKYYRDYWESQGIDLKAEWEE